MSRIEKDKSSVGPGDYDFQGAFLKTLGKREWKQGTEKRVNFTDIIK